MVRSTKKKIYTIFALFIFAVVIQGCATTGSVKLSEQDRSEIKKLESIKVIHQRGGWPSLQTPVGVLTSNLTFGLSEDWTAGQKLVHKFDIGDPGEMIKDNFIKQVNESGEIANFISAGDTLDYEGGKIDAMKQKYQKGIFLKISSNIWQIWYYPFNWARYQMWFGANAELVRLDDSKVLWSANCRADQNDSDTAPSLDELTKDNSTVLKTWVENSSADCTNQLLNSFLGQI